MPISENCIVPGMPEEIYHADPCIEPSASRGFLNKLVRRNPAAAMIDHPRLNPTFKAVDNKDFDLGSSAHDYLLLGGERIAVLDFPDFRTNAAKAERDAAIKLGKTPIIKHRFETVEEMAGLARVQIRGLDEHADGLTNGKPECSIFWRHENGRWCRTRPDWITDTGWLDDYKTTACASPRQFMEGPFVDEGYHIQAFMGLRGYHAVTGQNAKGFRFFVQENFEPYCLYCVIVDDTMLEVAEAEFEHGMDLFDRCMKNGSWPGYSKKPYIVYPGYKANRAFEDVKEKRNSMPARHPDPNAPVERTGT